MRVSAKDKIGPFRDVIIATPDGDKIGTAYACDTDEKWYEEWVTTVTGKIAVVNFNKPGAALMFRRVERAQFDLVNRHTGEVLAEVR